MKKHVPDVNAPWLPPKYELSDATAIQALASGTADANQQKVALKWIIENCSSTYQPSYRDGPDGERNTIFAEGRRYVGLHIVTILKLHVPTLRRNDELKP